MDDHIQSFKSFLNESLRSGSNAANIKWVADPGWPKIKIEFVDIGDLKTNPNEPWSKRYAEGDGQKQVENLMKAVLRSNKVTALTVKGDNTIIDGRHRYEMLKQMRVNRVGVQRV